MGSVTLFWLLTGCLSVMAIFFLWRLKKSFGLLLCCVSGILGGTYLQYAFWGDPTGIKNYHSPLQVVQRSRQAALRPLLVQFKKAEQRYLLRVEVDPTDKEAWLQLAQIYLIQQDEQRAAEAFRNAD